MDEFSTTLILSRSLKEHFSGNSVKFFGCRVFSPFKTVPACRAYRHSEERNFNSIITQCCIQEIVLWSQRLPQVFLFLLLIFLVKATFDQIIKRASVRRPSEQVNRRLRQIDNYLNIQLRESATASSSRHVIGFL